MAFAQNTSLLSVLPTRPKANLTSLSNSTTMPSFTTSIPLRTRRILRTHTALCCPYFSCRRHKEPFKEEARLETHLRKFHRTTPQTSAAEGTIQGLESKAIKDCQIDKRNEALVALPYREPGQLFAAHNTEHPVQAYSLPIYNEIQLAFQGSHNIPYTEIGWAQLRQEQGIRTTDGSANWNS